MGRCKHGRSKSRCKDCGTGFFWGELELKGGLLRIWPLGPFFFRTGGWR
jgi:hypothetical protein